MKQFSFIFRQALILSALTISVSFAGLSSASAATSLKVDDREYFPKGDLGEPGPIRPRNARVVNDINLSVTSTNLNITFNKDLDEVTVLIKNSKNDIIYQTIETSASGKSFNVDISLWKSGTYSITVVNNLGLNSTYSFGK